MAPMQMNVFPVLTKKVLVGSEIPGVSLGYDGIREVKVAVGCKISWQSVDKDVDNGNKV